MKEPPTRWEGVRRIESEDGGEGKNAGVSQFKRTSLASAWT